MKRLLSYLTVLIGVTACYDDTKVWEELQKHDERLSQLEAICRELNDNVNSLQTIVKALEERDYVTGVSPVVEDGVETGYTISFTKNEAITIFHGKNGKDGMDGANGADGTDGENGKDGVDGKDGHTPMIGVKKDSDSIYYWTLDGEWLLGESGEKIRATGADGKDGLNGENGTPGEAGKDGTEGVTPQLSIIDGYWHISYENGAEGSWKQLGQATGADGKDGKSFFNSVKDTKDAVELELADGTQISLPKFSAFGISFDIDEDIKFSLGQTYRVGYTLRGTDADATISVITSDGLMAEVIPNDADPSSGDIFITTPMKHIERSTVAVMVSDGYGRMYMKALNFVYEGSMDSERPVFVVTSAESLNIPAEGGEFEIPVQTNLNYMVEIGEGSTEWLSSVQTKTLREGAISFTADANTGGRRYGFLYVCDMADRGLIQTICVRQEAGDEAETEFVEFADSLFAKYMIDHYDLNLDGVLSLEEAEKVTALNIASMKFTDLTGIGHLINLESLDCSYNSITSLDLRGNAKLKVLNCTESRDLATLDLSCNVNLEMLKCQWNSSLTELNLSACKSLKSLYCHSCRSLTEITISDASELEELDLSNFELEKFDLSTCTNLRTATITCALSSLNTVHCVNLESLNCKGNEIEYLDLSRCLKLKNLEITDNPVCELKLGSNPYLTSLRLSPALSIKVSGSKIKSISCGDDYAGDQTINIIDFSECPALESVSIVNFNGELDLRNLPDLRSIYFRTGNLSNILLDGSDNIESITLTLDTSRYGIARLNIAAWDFSGLHKLKNLKVRARSFPTELNLSDCNVLESLDIHDHEYKYDSLSSLRKLTIGKKPMMTNMRVYANVQEIEMSNLPVLDDLFINSHFISYLDLSSAPLLTKLDVSAMSSLQTLVLKSGAEIENVTVNRSTSYIPEHTVIDFE